MAEEINYFLLLMLMQQFGIVQPKRVARVQVISYDIIRVSRETQAYCAVTHANVTQNNKKITDCSYECAKNEVCVGFNLKEPNPQPICELFETTFTSLSLTPGCTYYEVSPKT